MMLHTRDQIVFRTAPPVAVKLGAAEGVIEGYGSVFGVVDSFGEATTPGCFTETIAEHRRAGTAPIMLWGHDPQAPIGRWETLKEDASGLLCSGQLNLDSAAGREAFSHLRARDLNGLSIGYKIPPGGRVVEPDGSVTLRALDLMEISIVVFPANARARVLDVKSITTVRDCEHLLADTWGLSRNDAKRLASRIFPALNEPEIDLDRIAARLEAHRLEIQSWK